MGTPGENQKALNDIELELHIAEALTVTPTEGLEGDMAHAIIRRIFNPVIVGTQNVPDRPCLFVGNHSLFALDGWILGPVLHKDLGRFVRPLADRALFTIDTLNKFLTQRGPVIGHPQVCSALMENGSDLLVFPGGAHEAVKTASEMYALQWRERYGFIKLAAKHGYTIMPFGIVGPDEFYGHLIEGHELPGSILGTLLKRIGLLTEDTRNDMIPPIPSGLFGSLIPKPQRCYIGFGQPLDLAQYKEKTLGKKKLQTLRAEVAGEVEKQLNELLLLRAQRKDKDSILRRMLTF